MADVYEYKAPQFVDFNSELDDSDDADKFFDVEEESSDKDEDKENNKQDNLTDRSPQFVANNHEKNEIEKESSVGRLGLNKMANKSPLTLSTTYLEKSNLSNETEGKKLTLNSQIITQKEGVEDSLSQDLLNVSLKNRKRAHFDGIEIKPEVEKQHCMVTRNDEKIKTPKIELRSRSVSKDCDQNKNRKRKSIYANDNKAPEKYMAMAEHILHYQKDTPPRFHSNKRLSTGSTSKTLLKMRQSYKPRRTIALTPKLLTTLRSRPVAVRSQQQLEDMELEEMKKNQIRAHPLNEKIFLPPKLPPKFEKPMTTLAPFNLTQITKKATQENEEEPYKFTANPVPTAIFEKPVGIAPKKEFPITVPESPAITKPSWAKKRVRIPAISNEFKKITEDLTSFGVPMPGSIPKRTEVKPFSFELRDKQMLEKKEKKIKEIIEAEKKMREFKAKPVPSYVASKDTTISSKVSLKSSTECEEAAKTFKARSPRVLRKEPFKPVTEHVHSEPLDIQLHTDRRALQRHQFELKKAEKEEDIANIKHFNEIRKKEMEDAEIARIRKETVHKAQPMPKFKTVRLNAKVSSNQPLTDPQSPKFTKRIRTTTLCSSNLAQK